MEHYNNIFMAVFLCMALIGHIRALPTTRTPPPNDSNNSTKQYWWSLQPSTENGTTDGDIRPADIPRFTDFIPGRDDFLGEERDGNDDDNI